MERETKNINNTLKSIEEEWKKNKKNLVIPKIFLAFDNENKKYFVIKDQASIIYLIAYNSNITYCIPRKYLTIIDDKYYKIENSNKLISVTCRSKNEYENFVLKKLYDKE